MVKGATFEDRERARKARSRRNRADLYVELMERARWHEQSPRKTLSHACDFLRAVAKELPDDEVYALAADLTRMADERNSRDCQ